MSATKVTMTFCGKALMDAHMAESQSIDADNSIGDPLDDEDRARLTALESLRDEFDARDWRDGVTLIPEGDFEDYARETAIDCGMIDARSRMASYIDWSKWARDCQSDYSVVDFDGETYYYRG